MKSKTLISISGWITLLFAVFHIFFYWMFDWESSLATLDTVNRGIMLTFSWSCTILLFGMAYQLLFHKNELIATSLGRVVLISYSAFWSFRVIAEFLFFGFSGVGSTVIILLCSIVAICMIIPALRNETNKE